jgi:RimJ/RimL family protein N-acetyltransferase
MLRGHLVDLEIMERTDLPIVKDWTNDMELPGEFEPLDQSSLSDLEKMYDAKGDAEYYFVRRKDGTRVGYMAHFKVGDRVGIGYMLLPAERGKGYGTEAVQLMTDYLFLKKDIPRIHAETHPDNGASQRVLEKAGYVKEGILRRSFFSRGVWRDTALWSIIREDWKAPRLPPRGHVRE